MFGDVTERSRCGNVLDVRPSMRVTVERPPPVRAPVSGRCVRPEARRPVRWIDAPERTLVFALVSIAAHRHWASARSAGVLL